MREAAWTSIQRRTLIDFVIIGGMKCGTSELYAYLRRHPSIRLSSKKEPNFFNDRDYPHPAGTWERGLEWYDSLFERGPGLRGEASTYYSKGFFDQRVASRIFDVNQNAKIIYLVRHPVDRAISAYFHRAFTGVERRLIHAALLSNDSHYVIGSMYYARIQPYLATFPGEQILLMQSEAFWQSPKPHLVALYEWLGIPVPKRIVSFTRPTNSAEGRSLHFIRRSLGVPHKSEALKAISSVLAKSGRSLNSAELAHSLGFSSEDRRVLLSKLTTDCRLLEDTFPGITVGWSL